MIESDDEFINNIHEQWNSANDNERLKIIRKLGKIHNSDAFEVLLKLIGITKGEVRCAVIDTLAFIDPVRSIDILIAELKDTDPLVRWLVSGILLNIADERTIEPLIQALNDEDSQIRIHAALALGKIGSPKALFALRLIQHTDIGTDYEGRKVSEMAATAIQQIKKHQNDNNSDISGQNGR